MTIYYSDLEASGTGHVGTTGDPFSWDDLLNFCNVSGAVNGDVVKIKGTKTGMNEAISLAQILSSSEQIIWEAWDLTTFGPWTLLGGGSLNCHSSGKVLLKDGRVCLTSGQPAGLLNMYWNAQVNYLGSAVTKVIKGCTCILGTANDTPDAGWIIQDSIIDWIVYDDGGSSGVATNCVFTDSESNVTTKWDNYVFTDCQYGWTAPTWPACDAAKELFAVSTLYSGVNIPPQPGNPPYTGYTTDGWGNARTGIGFGYMYVAPPAPSGPEPSLIMTRMPTMNWRVDPRTLLAVGVNFNPTLPR